MYGYEKREKRYCYLVSEADGANLPVACFDYLAQVANYLGCGWTTLYYMVHRGKVYKGYICERVILE